jgi:chromosome partitioning protein
MAKRIVYFNNKGGVGKTTLVYHTAWMLAELGYKVLVADFDPQTNLTAMFLPQARLEEVFLIEENKSTIIDSISSVIDGDAYRPVHIEHISNDILGSISLLIGNLSLSTYEDKLSNTWLSCLDGDVYSFKVTTVFDTLLTDAANKTQSDYVLIDIGPNLGAINRSVLIACDYVILPVASDLFSLQGIKNLGQTLKSWKEQWKDRTNRNFKPSNIRLPNGQMKVLGYICMQHTARESKPVKAYLRWTNKIPATYQKYILQEDTTKENTEIIDDNNCLGILRHYHSLMPLAMEARKPIFLLKPADGAIGSHYQAVQQVYKDFEKVTKQIIIACEQ